MPRLRSTPLIVGGKALVKVSSHKVRHILQSLLGYIPKGYYSPKQSGEWREVPRERIQEVLKIHGVKAAFWTRDLKPLQDWNDFVEPIQRISND